MVQNLVVIGRVKLRRSLEFIAQLEIPYTISYEPEQFPAIHLSTEGATFLLYATGSFVLTGIRDIRVATQKALEFGAYLEACGAT